MVPLAENAGMLEGELPLHIQAVQYWTAHSYPVELVKDSCIFYTYVTDHQMHINKMFFRILLFTNMFWLLLRPSSGCCTRTQTVYIIFILVFYQRAFVGLLHKYKIVFNA